MISAATMGLCPASLAIYWPAPKPFSYGFGVIVVRTRALSRRNGFDRPNWNTRIDCPVDTGCNAQRIGRIDDNHILRLRDECIDLRAHLPLEVAISHLHIKIEIAALRRFLRALDQLHEEDSPMVISVQLP